MSDDNKRFVACVGAIVITALIFGIRPTESWWTVGGFMLLVMLALHSVLGVSIVWIDGEGVWDKFGTVIMWSAVLAGGLGISLIVTDASTGLRVGAALGFGVVAAILLGLCGSIRDWWQGY